ncbi:P-loop containing nucleoside triphosphate hydrolase protein [Chlamydoabsidia padenii]|nr:P-loop containing nucleoside triphosphate hydrolase protein [Chlamydoabsidia padenii]
MLHSSPRIPTSTSNTPLARPGVFPGHTTNNRQYQQKQSQQHRTYISAYASSQSTRINSGTTTPLLTASTSTTSTSTLSTNKTVSRSAGTENVKVAVRCRPLSQKESFSKGENAWDIDTSLSRIRATDAALLARRPLQQPPSTEFHFDNVAYGSDNKALYESSVKPLIGQAMDGYNATVFAYGQTASGKTYTMMGTESEPGIIPRAVDEVFSYIKTTMNNEFLLRVSYLEIYNETIRDLLAPENDNLKIHENKQRGIYVAPVVEEVVTCAQDVLGVIQRGEGNRHISTTDYNLHSSRSHTIFQMIIESRQRSNDSTTISTRTTMSQQPRSLLDPRNRKESVKISQLNLIDLAGSEKAASNQERRKEGAFINKSLLTLGTVISKLTETGKNAGHIPYRDSKLTRILQTSLSGQAKVVVICTISPYVLAVDESINTLKFATRVKKIVLTAKNDAVMDDKALLQQYRSEIGDLKLKLQTANDVLLQEQKSNQSMLTAERQQYEQELFQMRLVRNALKERIDHLTKLILTSATVAPTSTDINHDTSSKSNNDKQQGQSVLSETSDPKAANDHDKATTDDNSGNDPWVLVRDLRRQIHELRQSNEQLQQQLTIKQQRLQQLEADTSHPKGLVDKVARLEAELSVTKAELELTSLIAKEAQDNDAGKLGSDDHSSVWDKSSR